MAFRDHLSPFVRASLSGLWLVPLVACAGMVEGEVDGDGVPPMLSGFWLEGDTDGDAFAAGSGSASETREGVCFAYPPSA